MRLTFSSCKRLTDVGHKRGVVAAGVHAPEGTAERVPEGGAVGVGDGAEGAARDVQRHETLMAAVLPRIFRAGGHFRGTLNPGSVRLPRVQTTIYEVLLHSKL